jgi:putative lipoic acid-binding regulatory protein
MTPQLPNIELIKSQHKFPGLYTFKVIGDNREDFIADALTLAMNAIGEDRECSHTARESAAGNHVAVTLSIAFNSAEEVHRVYENLLKLKGIRALF